MKTYRRVAPTPQESVQPAQNTLHRNNTGGASSPQSSRAQSMKLRIAGSNRIICIARYLNPAPDAH